jgi:hypothetical protein
MRGRWLGVLFICAFCCATTALAQSNNGPGAGFGTEPGSSSVIQSSVRPASQPYDDFGAAKGSTELALWSGGGHGMNGGVRGTSNWNVGLRYGRVLTNPHGPAWLRGRFEYTFDVIPIFWVFQPHGTAYGAGLDPLGLKWNLAVHHRIEPYVNMTGGVVFTNIPTPPGASRVNFIPSAAFGFHALRGRYNWSAEIRYLHISNAGLTRPNPGINTLQVRVGLGLFTQPK